MAKQILLSLTQQRRIPIPEILISAWKHANVVFKKFKIIVFQREEGGLNLSTQNCQGQKHVGRVVDIFSNWFCQNPLLHCILLSTYNHYMQTTHYFHMEEEERKVSGYQIEGGFLLF